MRPILVILILIGIAFMYLFVGAFASLLFEWAFRFINSFDNSIEIDDSDRWKLIMLWPIIMMGLIGCSLGYFPFWLSKKLAKKIFKDGDS